MNGEVFRIVRVGKETIYFSDAAWSDHKNIPKMREDFFPPGGCPVLARLLSGVQREGSCANNHKKMQRLWNYVHIPLYR